MKTILGLNIPTKGDVSFEGKNISEMGREGLRWYRSFVGYVQQDPYGALPPFMSVQQILEEPLIIGGMKKRAERIERIRKVMAGSQDAPGGGFPAQVPAHAYRADSSSVW